MVHSGICETDERSDSDQFQSPKTLPRVELYFLYLFSILSYIFISHNNYILQHYWLYFVRYQASLDLHLIQQNVSC